MTVHWNTYHTNVGQLSVLIDLGDDPAVIAAGFCRSEDLTARLGLDQETVAKIDRPDPFGDAITSYLDGDGSALLDVPVRQSGTDFQQRVWAGLRAIRSGQTLSYAQLAAEAGNPKAVRAVGTACGANLIAPFVPCHRVVRTDGDLGGYYYGVEVKRWLLQLEAVEGL